MRPEILIKQVSKRYGTVLALKGVSFHLDQGEIFGLIGPDGAGKTTLIRMLVTLLRPDSGELYFQGQDIVQGPGYVRDRIGYMPQRFSLYQDLTVEQNLTFFGDLYGVDRPQQKERKEKLYRFSKLAPFRDRKAGALSGGMKQKLALSCMLMHDPEVIILDEPTYGVDPVSRHEFWAILHELQSSGVSILVSTPYMEEAAECNRVAFIYDGDILGVKPPQDFVKEFQHSIFLLDVENPYLTFIQLQQTSYKDSIQLFGDGIHMVDRARLGQQAIREILDDPDIRISPIAPKLEDVFLDLLTHRSPTHERLRS